MPDKGAIIETYDNKTDALCVNLLRDPSTGNIQIWAKATMSEAQRIAKYIIDKPL